MFHLGELQWSIEIVRSACRLSCRIQADVGSLVQSKEDRSPVTVADLAVQAFVSREFQRQFPSAVIVGEESARRNRENLELMSHVARYLEINVDRAVELVNRASMDPSDDFWTLDPIDGTKGFLRRDHFAVVLAHIRKGEVVKGVVGCPKLGTITFAERGGKSWMASIEDDRKSPKPLSVSDRKEPKHARILRSVEAGHTDVRLMQEIVAELGTEEDPVLMDSQAKYVVLSRGEAELLFRLISPSAPDYKEKIWDQAAGSIILEEAGGRVTDLEGKPLDFSTGTRLTRNRGVLASNGWLHEEGLRALKALEA